jgi:regulatory protein
LLARREHSRAELARKLAPHAESLEALESLLDLLVLKKQLSDQRYAEERARSLGRKFGAARIRHDLKSKGIADEIAERLPLQADEIAKARAILSRKYRLPAASREESARRARFLQSRGFSYDVIRHLLSSIDNE